MKKLLYIFLFMPFILKAQEELKPLLLDPITGTGLDRTFDATYLGDSNTVYREAITRIDSTNAAQQDTIRAAIDSIRMINDSITILRDFGNTINAKLPLTLDSSPDTTATISAGTIKYTVPITFDDVTFDTITFVGGTLLIEYNNTGTDNDSIVIVGATRVKLFPAP